jgi:hypothetical protein
MRALEIRMFKKGEEEQEQVRGSGQSDSRDYERIR